MNTNIKTILDRLYKENHITFYEYELLSKLEDKVIITRYTLDNNTNHTWEPYKEIKIK
jgi:hypothetical protein